MKILFKDKKDFTKKLQNDLSEHYFVGGRDTLSHSMLECEVLSVKTSKVDNKIIRQMPNLKWILNRNYAPDNINLKHCQNNNVGVINISYTKSPILEWLQSTIKKEYYLPYYTVFTAGDTGKLLNKNYKHVQHLNLESSETSIYNAIYSTNTLIVDLPITDKTKCIINKDILETLPIDAKVINLGDGKVINNKDLLNAIKSGRVGHVTADLLDSNYRKELLETGKVIWTKGKAWKTNFNMSNYIKVIKKNITLLLENKPTNVILERENFEVEVFWE